MNYKLKKISGDASFREFYRLQKGRHTSIIVQAKKEKFKNLITYIIVNNILTKYRIKDKSELKHLGIFSDQQETIKIVEWPQLIDIPLSLSLIHI